MKRASEEFIIQQFPREEGPPRPAPPIWLPPPPPLSSEENSRASSSISLPRLQYPEEDEEEEEEEDEGYDEDANSAGLRWGRSKFTSDEIHALDTPLPPSQPHPQNTQVFHIQAKSSQNVGKCRKISRFLLILLPALCFTGAVHLINDIMTDFKLFSASFSLFQGLFWPSLVFLVIDLIWGRRSQDNFPKSGKCQLTFYVLLHSVLSSIAAVAQLLSIQRLNISVSLALSLSSTVFVILLSNINREKKFSLELISCAIMAYFGFIVVGIPAMANTRGLHAEQLTAGVVASLTASACAVPASFLLWKLRQQKVHQSLLGLSFAFHGSLLSLVIKLWMDSSLTRIDLDAMSVTWAAGLTTLVILGAIFIYLEGRFGATTNFTRLRFLVFILSCGWEIVRQGIWHNFPDFYDILGSVLVTAAFLLAIGFEGWSLQMSTQVKQDSAPFTFFPWLLARRKMSNVAPPPVYKL